MYHLITILYSMNLTEKDSLRNLIVKTYPVICTIDIHSIATLPRDHVYADLVNSKKTAARLTKSASLYSANKI